jgi:hypothetical protein
MASLKMDIKRSSEWLVGAFKALDKELDFSVKSVEYIEIVLSEQFEGGEPKQEGLFNSGLGGKLFAISSYIGEVVIRNTKASKWVVDDNDPAGEVNIKVISANGTEMFPAHRVMNRIQNGEEDNIYHYTALAVNEFMKFEGEIPEEFREVDLPNKPWWKFWEK